MCKVVSTVPKTRFEIFGVAIPKEWETVFIDYTASDDEKIKACEGADFLFVGSTHEVSAEVIKKTKSLRMIHVEGVGFNKVDYETAKQEGIPVCNNRASNNSAVAEHTVGLIIAALRKIPLGNIELYNRDYSEVQSEFRQKGIHELSAMHVGVIGMGEIGKETARMLGVFGCKISYYDAYRPTTEREKELNIEFMELDNIIKTCDVISLHVPVLPSTEGMIGKKQLGMMKKSALLVNTSRGELIDQDALVAALENGEIYCAAVDTVTPEPPAKDHPLLNMSKEASDRFIISPHIAGTTVEAFTRMLQWAIADFQKVLDGEMPNNIVNGVEKLKEI